MEKNDNKYNIRINIISQKILQIKVAQLDAMVYEDQFHTHIQGRLDVYGKQNIDFFLKIWPLTYS